MKPSTTLRIFLLALCIIGISLSHYLTPLHLHFLHDIFQRLYYLPIILAALWFGLRGGLLCALIVSLFYAPHIIFQWSGDLILEIEKYLEIVVYNIVGVVTGMLAQREHDKGVELQKTAQGLEDSYRELQLQSERIIAIEEQLRRSEKLSALGEMAAVLAHEIRNPLGSIRGTAEILRDDYQAGDPKYEFIDIQIKETERLNRVVEDFLRMARPQANDMQLCRIQDELKIIAALVANDTRERQVQLLQEPWPDDLVVMADSDKLRQAFLNIVINALQATPAGGSVVITTARIRDDNADVCEIRFRDSGAGIDSQSLQKIFEPFYTTKPDGTGLGLAITRKIIEGHAGQLQVESEPRHGTTIIVRLPIHHQSNEVSS